MEDRFDKALRAIEALDDVLMSQEDAYNDSVIPDDVLANYESVIPDIKALISYYESKTWRTDYEADEKGRLPANLKRGVLSEDGIYNLLTDYQRLQAILEKDRQV